MDKSRKARQRGSSITQRWLWGNLVLTAAILAVLVALFTYSSRETYYNDAAQVMMNRFSMISGQLDITKASTVSETSHVRSLALRRMVEQFDAKEEFEFMLLDSEGQVLSTSSGQSMPLEGQDFLWAMESKAAQARDVYISGAGERVLAMTLVVPYPAEDVAALRMVTSMTLVDEAVFQRFLFSALLALLLLFVSLWSGLFFINSIVRPLRQVEQTATRIARGELEARLPAAPFRDEIGRLCATINRMADDLQKTENLKNEFISSVSHELRTPLTSIKGWLETVEAISDPQDENYRKGIAIIGTETDRLYGMVEELLDFSRMQNGVKLNIEKVDLVAELTDVALFVQARIQKEGLELVYEEPEVMVPVMADPNRLRQVFINVIDNAVKYSSPGGHIRLELFTDGIDAIVHIADEGRGIAPEDLENVKQKFFKGKNAVRGSGIGLAVVDELIKAMDGAVDIASTLGEGTTVKIRLPLVPEPGESLPVTE